MPKRSPGARAKGIGAQLRALRDDAGLSLRVAAEAVGWDKGRLSRIETGQQNLTLEDAAALLAILRVTDERREHVLNTVRTADEPGWWERNLGTTAESAALADYESQAVSIADWAPLLIPGLLQTMDYAHAYMEVCGISSSDIGPRLVVRAQRQRAVEGKPYTAYIGETALRTVVGSRRVMIAQLDALIQRAGVSVRVVPASTPAHLGQLGGFLALHFEAAPMVVHVELLKSGVFHDEDELTKPYEQALNQVAGVAHSETESARLIRSIRKEMEG